MKNKSKFFSGLTIMKNLLRAAMCISMAIALAEATHISETPEESSSRNLCDAIYTKEAVEWNPSKKEIKNVLMGNTNLVFAKNLKNASLQNRQINPSDQQTVFLHPKDTINHYDLFAYTPNTNVVNALQDVSLPNSQEPTKHNILINFIPIFISHSREIKTPIQKDIKTKRENTYVLGMYYFELILNIAVYELFKNDPTEYNKYVNFIASSQKNKTTNIILSREGLKNEVKQFIDQDPKINIENLEDIIAKAKEKIEKIYSSRKIQQIIDINRTVEHSIGPTPEIVRCLITNIEEIFIDKRVDYLNALKIRSISKPIGELFKKRKQIDYLVKIIDIFVNKEETKAIGWMLICNDIGYDEETLYVKAMHMFRKFSTADNLRIVFETNDEEYIEQMKEIFKKDSNYYIAKMKDIFKKEQEQIADRTMDIYEMISEMYCLIVLLKKRYVLVSSIPSYAEIWHYPMVARYIPEDDTNSHYIQVKYMGIDGKLSTKKVKVSDTNVKTILSAERISDFDSLVDYNPFMDMDN